MWENGDLIYKGRKYEYTAKVYETGSKFGINKGRISKLTINREGIIVLNYDRGWDIRAVDDDTYAVLNFLLEKKYPLEKGG